MCSFCKPSVSIGSSALCIRFGGALRGVDGCDVVGVPAVDPVADRGVPDMVGDEPEVIKQ
jgi:hypothetical protein